MAKLRLFVDRLSQPSRAIIIFCLANGLDAEENLVDLGKGEHRKPEYKAINPMGQVPAVDDDGFYLFESHAILRYLASAYPNVKEHWYPVDVKKRAQIECILDWHHTNLRRGSAGLVMNRVIAPALGHPLDPKAASECEALVKASLDTINTLWLNEDGSFLKGSSEPSIADLSLACEVTQLQFLGEETKAKILSPYPKVRNWLDAVEKATSPHFESAHEKLRTLAAIFEQRRESQSSEQPAAQSDL
ncbi:hypothetical protein GOP47_0019808 [Adiantum capillus-veneris]|uniref:Glutathione S-transferase n=1 Tax=Adiantum capillus-veneris TaxID=13818 RepID=A0A9D4UBR6_ADICA|nr:hypothetical protein GOP47_0019808 [Adiantum capillus-veneris]